MGGVGGGGGGGGGGMGTTHKHLAPQEFSRPLHYLKPATYQQNSEQYVCTEITTSIDNEVFTVRFANRSMCN